MGSGWKVGVAVHDGSDSFIGWQSVVAAVVKKGVKKVGSMAFRGCRNMTKARGWRKLAIVRVKVARSWWM